MNQPRKAKAKKPWRDWLRVHPAAELFPLMSPDELRALSADIKKNGLRSSAILQLDKDFTPVLLDGRNRLDALTLLGDEITLDNSIIFDTVPSDIDPYAIIVSANIHRRHLTAEQKRELIAKLIKADLTKSNRQIADQVKVSHPHVAKVRAELETTGDVETVTTSIDTKGRRQPRRKPAQIAAAVERAVARSEENQRKAASRFAPDVAMAPHAERGLDVYETPPVAVHALLKVEPLAGRIWEPACGPGAIVRVLREAGHDVVATDLADYGCPGSRGGVDFLTQSAAPDGVKVILTNPPYRRANKFVRHALRLAPRVIMLLPLRFLEGERRSDILEGGKLARFYVFRNRLPMLHRHGWSGNKIETGKAAYAWFIWNDEHRGSPLFDRISWKPEPAPPPADDGTIPNFLRRTDAVPS